jgi:hypothetical protein
MVATVVGDIDQVPPPVLVKVVVAPTHTTGIPDIAVGKGLTVMANVAKPVVAVYVITAVPVDMPVSTPVLDPIVAIPGAVLLHVPPIVALESVVDKP